MSVARDFPDPPRLGAEARFPELHVYQPPAQSDYLFRDPVDIDNLYLPQPGRLIEKQQEKIDLGTKRWATYASALAMHEVRIYQPEDESGQPLTPKPSVLMTTPLGTGINGHSDRVAREIAASGCNVILKGVPRYYGLRPALTINEDANELHGLVKALAISNVPNLGSLETIYAYGESQAAVKMMGALALAGSYDRQIADGLAVAFCFLERADYDDPIGLFYDGVSMAKGLLSTALKMSPKRMWQERGAFDIRDFHNHLGVIPDLMSGEAGKFLPHIDRLQTLTNYLFGNDGFSRPHRTKSIMDSNFPAMNTKVVEDFGHIDGVKSADLRLARKEVFSKISHTLANS